MSPSSVREVVPGALAGERLDRVVSMLSGCSRAEAAELVATGAVRVDGRTSSTRSVRLAEGEVVEIDLPAVVAPVELAGEGAVVVPVVYEDDDLLVIDKPPGMVVHPGAGQATGTLVHGLLASHPEIATVGEPGRPGIVHRLDKGTSGLMLVARTAGAYEALVAALAGRRVDRRYRTLVWGHPGAPAGMVDAPIGRSARDPTRMAVTERGKPARTRYEVVRRVHAPVEVAELTCTLETGRTHQIRVHLRSIGHPVVGDARYGGARQSLPAPRPFLHAEHLGLAHPRTGSRLELTSPLPVDLQQVLNTLS